MSRCVTPHEDGWAIRTRKEGRASEVRATKLSALDRAWTISRNAGCPLVIYDERGQRQGSLDPQSDDPLRMLAFA